MFEKIVWCKGERERGKLAAGKMKVQRWPLVTKSINCLLTCPFIDPSFLSPYMDPSFLDPHSVDPFVDPFVEPFVDPIVDPFMDLIFFLTAFYRRKVFCENGNN